MKSNDIKLTRLYSAPLKAVWEAYTEVEQTSQWWGPRGFTLTSHSKDLKSGGHWSYTMHGPDGVDYPNHTKYLVVEKYSKLVYDHGGNDRQPPMFRVTVEFSEIDSKTKMDMTMTLPSPEAAEQTRKFIKKAGGDATWDRLAEYLELRKSGRKIFVINRSFAAPLALMFEVWTKPKHLVSWLAPTGFQMEFLKADIRPQGRTFYSMSGAAGPKMFGRAEYEKIEPPHRISYSQQFCDENEKVARHPMSPHWPETMHTIVEFTAESSDQTRVTVTWEPHQKATRDEIETFESARGGMTQGWTGSFDKLDSYLSLVFKS